MNTGNSARRKGKQREIFHFIIFFFLGESFGAILSRGFKKINKTCGSRNFPPRLPPLHVLLHRPPLARSCAASREDRGGIEEGSRKDRGRSHGSWKRRSVCHGGTSETRTAHPVCPYGSPRAMGGDKRILGVSGSGDPLSTAPSPPPHPFDPVLPKARAPLSAFISPKSANCPSQQNNNNNNNKDSPLH